MQTSNPRSAHAATDPGDQCLAGAYGRTRYCGSARAGGHRPGDGTSSWRKPAASGARYDQLASALPWPLAPVSLQEMDLTDRPADAAAPHQLPPQERAGDDLLARALRRARWTIFWERLWPALAVRSGDPCAGVSTATTPRSRCRARSTCSARGAFWKNCAGASARTSARSSSSTTSSGCCGISRHQATKDGTQRNGNNHRSPLRGVEAACGSACAAARPALSCFRSETLGKTINGLDNPDSR
jgi:hypothetical protein